MQASHPPCYFPLSFSRCLGTTALCPALGWALRTRESKLVPTLRSSHNMGVAFPAQGASGRQPGCCSLQEKTDKLRREVEKWGWPGHHGVLLGQPCARGFLDLLASFPTAVQEAGMCRPGLTAKEMAQSSTVTCPGLHSWHLTFHLCDSEAQASFWDALPLVALCGNGGS